MTVSLRSCSSFEVNSLTSKDDDDFNLEKRTRELDSLNVLIDKGKSRSRGSQRSGRPLGKIEEVLFDSSRNGSVSGQTTANRSTQSKPSLWKRLMISCCLATE